MPATENLEADQNQAPAFAELIAAQAQPTDGVPRAEALCNDEAGTLVGLFFSEQLDDIARAKSICRKCPVREACLAGARERREPWGVWGGELFMNGKILAYKRKRGRPPKHPRPEELAAAMGVPVEELVAGQIA